MHRFFQQYINSHFTPSFHSIKFSLLAISLGISLSACQTDMSDLTTKVAQIKARPAGIIDPIPEQQPYLSYSYPQHRRDPFNSSKLKPSRVRTIPEKVEEKPKVEKGVPLDLTRPPEFLESYPLDSLGYVGTVSKEKTEWALIKNKNGAVHRVKRGNYLGQDHGKIINITETKLYLQETVPNGLGGYKHRETTLELVK
ncbi:MAG TPA: pilus assembly protein PilP [Thiothrix sp.]|nr:pilus assembly protein PilP [Thiothrix sp.]